MIHKGLFIFIDSILDNRRIGLIITELTENELKF